MPHVVFRQDRLKIDRAVVGKLKELGCQSDQFADKLRVLGLPRRLKATCGFFSEVFASVGHGTDVTVKRPETESQISTEAKKFATMATIVALQH